MSKCYVIVALLASLALASEISAAPAGLQHPAVNECFNGISAKLNELSIPDSITAFIKQITEENHVESIDSLSDETLGKYPVPAECNEFFNKMDVMKDTSELDTCDELDVDETESVHERISENFGAHLEAALACYTGAKSN